MRLFKFKEMKNSLYIILFLLFTACSKESAPLVVQNETGILLLQVDYMTHQFEQGVELKIATVNAASDSLPITVQYKPPGDFGNISFYYKPTNDLIFDGSIIWMGSGEITYPKTFLSPQNFPLLNYTLEKPGDSRFQRLFAGQAIDLSLLWNAINKLEIMTQYLGNNKKIGYFLYTPSVGMGNPNEWDWFIIISK